MERERFLDSIAERLGRSRLNSAPERAPVRPPWPLIEAPLAARFVSELERVGGTWERADSALALLTQLSRAISASRRAPRVEKRTIVAARRAVFEDLGLDTAGPPFERVAFWGDEGCNTAERFQKKALSADLGITTAVCGIASTGTLLLEASGESPRSVSLLPRRHLAVLRESAIVPELDAALSLGARATSLQGVRVTFSHSRMPSALFCITGPSRTSDIENDLSIGVHGPAEVHVILYSSQKSGTEA